MASCCPSEDGITAAPPVPADDRFSKLPGGTRVALAGLAQDIANVQTRGWLATAHSRSNMDYVSVTVCDGSERLFNGLVEGDVDLGNENVGIRGVVQDVGEPFQVHRALVGRLLVIHAGSGPDRIAAHQAPQRTAVGTSGAGIRHPW